WNIYFKIQILADTLFTRKELRAIYRAFKETSPFSRDTFRVAFAMLFPYGDIEHYADLVFETFEPNDHGFIDFHASFYIIRHNAYVKKNMKFIKIFSALARGPLNEKLDWIYKLYDPVDTGKIDWDRIFYVVTAINDLMGKKFDKSKKGWITKEEFMEICSTDEDIFKSISSLCNISECSL
ncbi:unnamed protein product, partial [Dracunculus medinensis]|uniref:EF-hand domain-containing protein n=1 Tax=Dracunculus medinensis TaxID=318479 RepID=A0A0N4U550_DRAME